MLVRNWMSKNVIAIDENDSMQHASTLMREHKVRMLPVLKHGELVGIISDSDLKRASASDATLLDIHELLYLISKIKVRDIMTRNPVTVPDDYTVEETAQKLMDHDISGVPVMDGKGKLAGVITRYDIFKILITLSGLGRGGIQFALLIDDKAGSIKPLADVCRKYGGRIASVLSNYENAPEGKRIVYLRVYDVNRSSIPDIIRELRENGTLIYQVDHEKNERLIFQDMKA